MPIVASFILLGAPAPTRHPGIRPASEHGSTAARMLARPAEEYDEPALAIRDPGVNSYRDAGRGAVQDVILLP